MIEPFWKNSRVTIYCGNSIEILEEFKNNGKRFDLLLTDPPYGINQRIVKPTGLNAERGKGKYDGEYFVDDIEYMHNTVRPIIDLALSICTLGIVTGGTTSYKWLPFPDEQGCMYMPAAVSFNSWAHQDFQPIFYYGKPKGNIGKYRKLSHVVSERPFTKEHPCSKPLEFWKALALCGTDGEPEKTILDPFGGGGTTGRTALDLGLHATLIEINPKYCELIAKNCAQDTLF